MKIVWLIAVDSYYFSFLENYYTDLNTILTHCLQVSDISLRDSQEIGENMKFFKIALLVSTIFTLSSCSHHSKKHKECSGAKCNLKKEKCKDKDKKCDLKKEKCKCFSRRALGNL